MIKQGAGDKEQQVFLLSCFYGLSIKAVNNIDIRLIELMIKDMHEYLYDNKITEEEIDFELKLVKKIEEGEEESEGVEDRFGIMDL